MNPNDPNLSLLERAAEQLDEALLEQLVFVGGAVAGVLITDPAMPEIRPTQDVVVICSVIARSDDHQLGRQLRQRGFQEDSRPGAPLCRWCTVDLILDLMPTQGEILGLTKQQPRIQRGESNTKKIENLPRISRFKISSLQLLGECRSSS
jgi:hypothetical protein